MRGFFFGGARRNQPLKLEDPRPIAKHGTSAIESGDAGKDGFTVLSRANPQAPGNPPAVPGGARPTYWHGGESFEQ